MKDKKIIIAVIAFALVLVLTLVSTYAYFTATASGNENKTVNVKTAQLGIEYAHGTKVQTDSSNLHANWDGYFPVEVESLGTVDQYFDIIWDTISKNTIVGNYNGLDVKSDFTWTLYKLPSAFNVEVEEDTEEARAEAVRAAATLIESGTQETTGYLYGTQSGDTILDNKLIEPSETQYYVLHIHFNYDANRNQDYQQGKEFIGNIKVIIHEEETLELVEGDPLDWQVSEEPNATGGYTLEAFTGNIEDCNNFVSNGNHFSDEYIDQMSQATGLTLEDIAYDATIPNVVDGKQITEIADGFFRPITYDANDNPIFNVHGILTENITISEGIKVINNDDIPFTSDEIYGAFGSMPELKSVTFHENSVERIGKGAFFNCRSLTSVSLPDSLKTIDEGAFVFTNMSTITIPASVEIIGDKAFGFADASTTLTSITFETENGSSSLQSIGDEAFYEAPFTSITLPNGLETIGNHAFAYSQLTSLIIPDTVITIGDYAFGSTPITTLSLGNGVQTIGEDAFYNIDVNEVINIPLSVTSIGAGAFITESTDPIFQGTAEFPNRSYNFVGRTSTAGISLGTSWNGAEITSTTDAPYPTTCSGTTCS